jgi:hypothetical protein
LVLSVTNTEQDYQYISEEQPLQLYTNVKARVTVKDKVMVSVQVTAGVKVRIKVRRFSLLRMFLQSRVLSERNSHLI